MATLFQVNINRKNFDEPVDMQDVYNALQAASVEFDAEERAPGLSGEVSEEQPEYVYVYEVGEAVRVINNLGYTTDEDDYEADYE